MKILKISYAFFKDNPNVKNAFSRANVTCSVFFSDIDLFSSRWNLATYVFCHCYTPLIPEQCSH